ncbi:MAG: hypothetical protein J0H53_07970 [Rhizobiales bacterium]|nr:hypothetical protein [Hyphomicrobiales bacterium]
MKTKEHNAFIPMQVSGSHRARCGHRSCAIPDRFSSDQEKTRRTTAAPVSRNASRLTFSALPVAVGLAIAMSFARPAAAEPTPSGFVYTADEFGKTVSRIDLESGKVDIIPVDITPHNVQFVSGRGRLLAVGIRHWVEEPKVMMAVAMVAARKATEIRAQPVAAS